MRGRLLHRSGSSRVCIDLVVLLVQWGLRDRCYCYRYRYRRWICCIAGSGVGVMRIELRVRRLLLLNQIFWLRIFVKRNEDVKKKSVGQCWCYDWCCCYDCDYCGCVEKTTTRVSRALPFFHGGGILILDPGFGVPESYHVID